MKFRVFVSGETEEFGIPKLLDRLFSIHGFHERHIHIVRKQSSGKKHLLSGISTFVRHSFADRHLSCVISLEDSDNEDIVELKKKYKEKVNEEHKNKYRPKFAKNEIETWLLADAKALEEYGLSEVEEIENPEIDIKIKSSQQIDQLFKKNQKKYKKTIDGPALLATLNIPIVYKKCPSFKNFIDNIFEVLNEPNPYLNL